MMLPTSLGGGGNIEDTFIVHSFTADKRHPARNLDEEKRSIYVNSVGELLSTIPCESKKLNLAYSIWSNSLGICQTADNQAHKHFYLRKATNTFGYYTKRQYTCLSIAFDFLTIAEKALGDVSAYLPVIIASLKKTDKRWIPYIHYVFTYIKAETQDHRLPQGLLARWKEERKFTHRKECRVIIAATMSAGKSTLVNALVGHKINEVRATACTSRVHYIHNKQYESGALARFDGDKYVYTDDYSLLCSEVIEAAALPFNSNLRKERVCLIDTPGVNFSGDSSHQDITHRIISSNDFDLLVVVLNSKQLAINDEKEFVSFVAKNCKRKVIFALNKLDSFNPDDGDSIEDAIDNARQMAAECGVKSQTIIPVSGLGAFIIRQQSQSNVQLSATDTLTLDWIRRLADMGYFNLPRYAGVETGQNSSDRLLWLTGLPLLESTIIKELQDSPPAN